MATSFKNYQIALPQTEDSFYTDDQFTRIQTNLANIQSNYGTFINRQSQLSNVPAEIIKSFIFIESSGQENAKSGAGAIGLMQITPNSMNDILVLENQKNRLSVGEKAYLTELIGADRANQVFATRVLGRLNVITTDDLLDPATNIFIGTIYLGLLIDRFTENKVIRLDKVVIQYNMGWFANKSGTTLQGNTIDDLIASVNKESSTYITKLLGQNGVLLATIS